MLEAVENSKRLEQLQAFCTDSFGISILALLSAYPPELGLCRYWLQTDDNNNTTAVVCSNGGEVILCDGNADYDEIAGFLSVIGFSGLLCKEESAKRLGFDFNLCGITMHGSFSESENHFEKPETTADYFKVYRLLGLDGSFGVWFADITRRILHGSADMRVIRVNGEIVSTACAVSISGGSRLIGAVATDEKHRGRGYASALVKALAGGDTYLRCMPELEGFYNKLGFERVGKWSVVK